MNVCRIFGSTALVALAIGTAPGARAERTERLLRALNELKPPATLIIFGATQSMRYAGRLDYARDFMAERLAKLEAEKRAFGLITHGQDGCSCDWVNLVVEPSDKKGAAEIMDELRFVNPNRVGSITGALERAVRLIEPGGTGIRDVLVVTDVGEVCRGDPKAAARELRKLGVRVNVFAIDTSSKASAELREVAAEGGGTFEWHYAVGPGGEKTTPEPHRAIASENKSSLWAPASSEAGLMRRTAVRP